MTGMLLFASVQIIYNIEDFFVSTRFIVLWRIIYLQV